MPRNVLVVGEAGLLASYLAASRLLSTDDSVFFDIDCAEGPFSDDELATLVRHAIRQVAMNEHLDSFEERLHRPAPESNGAQTDLSKTSLGETLVSEVWYGTTGTIRTKSAMVFSSGCNK